MKEFIKVDSAPKKARGQHGKGAAQEVKQNKKETQINKKGKDRRKGKKQYEGRPVTQSCG